MTMEYQDKHCVDEEVRDIAHEVETIRKSLDLPEPEEGVVINTYESFFSYYKNIFLAHALAKNIRADMRWQQHLELERFPFQPESIQETGH